MIEWGVGVKCVVGICKVSEILECKHIRIYVPFKGKDELSIGS